MPCIASSIALLSEPQALGGTAGPDLTRYLLVCSALLLVVAVLAVAFRRLAGKSLALRAARRSLQVMDVLPLGGRSRLAVVRCYDRTFLLGMGEREVSLVAELDPVIEPAGAPLPAEADRRAFASWLERAEPRQADALRPDPLRRAPAVRPRDARAEAPGAAQEPVRAEGWVG